ncbi:AzlD domain-containing protein [Yoonia sp. F2084L]|nr:AzlD domain-containing protein [Yoonia sp. F2084L]
MIAAITFASRIAGPLLMTNIIISPRIERFLNALSVSVIAALVASIVAQNGLREGAAVGLAAFIMLGSKSAVWAMVSGMALAAAWALFFH